MMTAIIVLSTSKFNRNNRHKCIYPNMELARRPHPHSEEISIAMFSSLPMLPEDDSDT